jgi:hypothetical protein
MDHMFSQICIRRYRILDQRHKTPPKAACKKPGQSLICIAAPDHAELCSVMLE